MIQLDEGEIKLFSKYWGNNDLVNNEEFWGDIYAYYSKEPHDAPLPLRYTPTSARMVLEMLNCPPGKCGACCSTYKVVRITAYDVERIIKRTSYDFEYLKGIIGLKDKDGNFFMNSYPNGCPFLKKNKCTIYEARPDACYLFPIGCRDATQEGGAVLQMIIRIRCRPALDVTRELIAQAMKGDKLLLPDLTIIPKVSK